MDDMIYVENLKKSYRSFQLNIPEFRVKCGEIVGLIGENGAGKTTFLDILLNRRVQDEGEVFLYGIEGFLLGIIFNGINIPVTYRYGAEASKYFMLLFITVPVILVYVFYFLHIDTNQIIVWGIKNKFFMIIGCIVGIIFLICCSIKVSIVSYRNRL